MDKSFEMRALTVIRQQLGVADSREILLRTPLLDLGADEIDCEELRYELGVEFDVNLPEEAIFPGRTVGQVIGVVYERSL